jgi:hypothetical protein
MESQMSKLRFSDGVEIDTSGEPRLLELHDGWYVVGHGQSIPCKDKAEAIEQLKELKAATIRQS